MHAAASASELPEITPDKQAVRAKRQAAKASSKTTE